MESTLNATLIEACKNGKTRQVKEALLLGADIHADADAALRKAAEKGYTKIVKLLLNHDDPADVHALDDEALRASAEKGFTDIVKLLLAKNANVHAVGEYPLLLSARNGHANVVKLLLNHSDPANIHVDDDWALRLAAKNGYTDVVKVLLRHRDPADVHAQNDEAFISTVEDGHKETGIELLRFGANQHDNPRVRTWVTELSWATQKEFSGGVTEAKCFTDGYISDAALDACATGQFGTLIGAPLLVAKNFELFKRVWEALPECWQEANPSLHSQFARTSNAAWRGK